MHTRSIRFITLLVLLIVPLVSVGNSLAAPTANSAFQRTWARTDKPVAELIVNRTWMWGPQANTGALIESYADAPGGSRMVQYFDKSRMEDNSYRATDPWDVTNGLLVVELMTGKMQVGDNAFQSRAPAQVNVGGDADDPTGPTYATMALVQNAPASPNGAAITQRLARNGTVSNDPVLGGYGVTAAHRVTIPNLDHQVASVFWNFMNSSGVVWVNGIYSLVPQPLFLNPFYATGYPVTEPYWANIKVGGVHRDVLMQCFERRCLTYTPGNPNGWQVEAGNVGQHYYTWRYQQVNTQTVWTKSSGSLVATTLSSWQLVPDMQLNVNVPSYGDMAITYSAETGGSGTQMFVRALVDGQPTSPSDVAFAVLTKSVGAHSFTFGLHGISAGTHTVQIQWAVNPGSTGSMGRRTMSVVLSPPSVSLGSLAVQTAPSGPWVTTTASLSSWENIPNLSTNIMTPANSDLAITLSAEAYTSGARMFTRVLVDGQEANPSAPHTVFGWGEFAGTHAFTWAKENVGAGSHNVVVQWAVDGVTTGYMADRTLTVSASPSNTATGGLAIHVKELDTANTSSNNWTAIPDMNVSIATPSNGVLAITLSGDGWNSTATGRSLVRALVDGQPAQPSDALFIQGDRREARAFTFEAKNLSGGTHTVEMQWLSFDTGVTAYLWDRSLTVVGRPAP